MTYVEMLLELAADESANLGLRATEALRRGPNAVTAGQTKDNVQRMCFQLLEVMHTVKMLEEAGVALPELSEEEYAASYAAKRRAVFDRAKKAKIVPLGADGKPIAGG